MCGGVVTCRDAAQRQGLTGGSRATSVVHCDGWKREGMVIIR